MKIIGVGLWKMGNPASLWFSWSAATKLMKTGCMSVQNPTSLSIS